MLLLLNLQYLRAIAALAVLLHHACERLGTRFVVGAARVDLSFVISGFIMIAMMLHSAPPAGRFLWQRLVRIAPLYWGVTLGMVTLAVVAPGLLPQFTWDTQRLISSLLFLPHLDPSGQIFPLVIPGWTLNYEMFFYGLVALALLAPSRIRLPIIFGSLLALVGLGAAFQPESALLRVWTNPLLIEFLAGGVLAVLHLRGWRPNRPAGVILLAAGIACYAAQELGGVFSEGWRVLLWGLPAVLILMGALALERREAAPIAPLRLLGDASYSIYLTHPMVVAVAVKLVGVADPSVFLATTLLLAVLVGLSCFLLFERPFTRFLRDLPGSLRGGSPRPKPV